MSWSTICIRWRTWRHCLLQGQFSYTTSSHIKRLTFVDISSISLPRALKRGTPKLLCHSPLSSWALLQRQDLNFWAVSQLYKETFPLVLTRWLEVKLTSLDPRPVSHKYQGIMLRKRVEILRRRLTDSPQHQKVLLNHPLKHKHRDPIVLIASLLG